MDLRSNLLALADSYCAARGISRARLATLVVNDGKFFERVGRGGDFTIRTYERFVRYFADHPCPTPAAEGTNQGATP